MYDFSHIAQNSLTSTCEYGMLQQRCVARHALVRQNMTAHRANP